MWIYRKMASRWWGLFWFRLLPRGWDVDYWYDMRCYLNELSEEQRRRSRQPEESYQPDFSEGFTYAHRCSDRAIKFLEQYKEEDFSLRYHMMSHMGHLYVRHRTIACTRTLNLNLLLNLRIPWIISH